MAMSAENWFPATKTDVLCCQGIPGKSLATKNHLGVEAPTETVGGFVFKHLDTTKSSYYQGKSEN